MFVVQGSKLTPDKVNIEMDKAIGLMRAKIENLEEARLNDYKVTILDELKKQETNLKERSDKLWKEIIEGGLDFERTDKLIEALKYITKNDLFNFFESVFYTKVKKLSIQVY